jgi:hypothetical protein
VIAEVVSPQRSEDTKESIDRMRALGERVMQEKPGADIEVFLLTDPSAADVETVLDRVRGLGAPSVDTVIQVGHIAHVSYKPAQPWRLYDPAEAPTPIAHIMRIEPAFMPPDPPDQPLLYWFGNRQDGDVWTRSTVTSPVSDDRVE